ncbi:DUF2975 domain-containing protein [Leeuwenhoekiella marinoflava]|uniref:DUF2975 domain-containing protein n=1 Tax=Leeuwenhoekiella marinoflava TaxID=988 RepID=UPI0030039C87
MNLGKLFKVLLDILFYIIALITIYQVIITVFSNVIPEILKSETTNSITYEISFIIFLLFLTFILYQFRKFGSIIRDNRLFSNEAIFKSKNIGILFNILGIIIVLSRTIDKLDNLDFLQIISTLFIPNLLILGIPCFVVGIFFLLLSDGFKKALALKEENDLTV